MSGYEQTKAISRRQYYLTLIQIIAMVLIVLSHSVTAKQTVPTWISNLVPCFQSIGLTAFMMVSGYLQIITDAVKKYGYGGYLKKRATRLLIPFFVVQLVMLLPKWIMAIGSHTSDSFTISLLLNGFLFPREGILPHLWFLPTLMIITLLAPLIAKAVKHPATGIMAVVIAFVLILLPDIANLFCVNDVRKYLFWYVAGAVAARWIGDGARFSKKYVAAAMILSAVGYIVVILFIPKTVPGYAVYAGLLSTTFLYAGTLLVEASFVLFCKLVGGDTFTIYILSLPAQNVAEIVCAKLSLPIAVTTASMAIVGLVLPVLVAVLVRKIEKKTHHTVLSKCLGVS